MRTLCFIAVLLTPLYGQNLLQPEEIIQKIQARDLSLYPKIQNSLHLYLSSEDPRLRESVMVALAQIPLEVNEIELLATHLPTEKRHSIRASILKQLEPHVGNRDDLKGLVASAISEPFEGDDAVAAAICSKIAIPQAIEGLVTMAKDPNFANGAVALEALGSGYFLPPSFYEWLRTAEVASREETENVKKMMGSYPADYLKNMVESMPSFRFQQAAIKMLSEFDEGGRTGKNRIDENNGSYNVNPVVEIKGQTETYKEHKAVEPEQQFRKPTVQSITLPLERDLKWPVFVSIAFCLMSFFIQKRIRKIQLRWICAFFLCLSASFLLMSQDLFPQIAGMQSSVLLRKISFNLVWPTFYLGIAFIFIALPVYLWIPRIVRNLPTILRGMVGVACAAAVALGPLYGLLEIDPFLPAALTCGFIVGVLVPAKSGRKQTGSVG